MKIDYTQAKFSARRHLGYGVAALLLLVIGFGGWATQASIAGAVVSFGNLQVEAQKQVVQHPDGGVVKEILVKDGDTVKAGDLLLNLDASLLEAEKNILGNQIVDAALRMARLTAERDDLEQIDFTTLELENLIQATLLEDSKDVQNRLFSVRLETEKSKIEQLRLRQDQFQKGIEGVHAQKKALRKQLSLIKKELADQKKMYEKGLARVTRVYELERVQSELQGRIGEFDSQMAETKGRISEIEIEILKSKSMRREQAISGLRELKAQSQDLQERYYATVERLNRLEVRSPRDGIVLEMKTNTLNSVVRPAEPILYVVPSDSALLVEARIEPASIDDVFPGQSAGLRFTSFNARTTPEINGYVDQISADVIEDKATGGSYYLLKVKIEEDQLALLDEQILTPGMPVDVFLKTGEHSPVTYLAKPFTDYFSRAFRE